MRRYIFYILSFVAAIFSSDYLMAESWTGQTKGTFTLDSDVSITAPVKLTGDLTISVGSASHTIRATKDMACIFWVYQGQTLTIKGEDGKRIIIDGGANFDNLSFSPEMTSFRSSDITGVKLEEAIFSRGKIDLQYVDIRNVNAYLKGDPDGGAICIKGKIDGGKSLGETVLNHCSIYNSAAENGSAIYFTCENDFVISADDCAVKLIDSEIYHCFSSGTYAGTIRSTGKAKSNLILENTTIRDNFSNGAGGAVYWNGAGTDDTICSIDGCTFSGNIAGDMGGALMLETTFEIVKKNTQKNTVISNNRVFRKEGEIDDLPRGIGGGIIIPSYTGKSIATKASYDFDYTLSDNLVVENNYAPVGGAGVAFAFAWFDVSSATEENIDLEITLDGATISGNKTDGNGAGIYVWNNTSQWSSKHTYEPDIKINLNKGTLSYNTAEKNGAGIYSYLADIENTAESFDLLTIAGNISSGYGGGIYVDGGTQIKLAKTKLISNSASYGGALAISTSGDDLYIELGESTIESNKATEDGGAIYMPSGTLSITDPQIKSNTASANGGAIYVKGSVEFVGQATLSDNSAKGSENSAKGNGGVAYVDDGSIDIQYCETTIQNNTAVNGGAFYVSGGDIITGEGLISENIASSDGGAFYLNGGKVSVGKMTMRKNKAVNGGAIALHNGQFQISPEGRIMNNTATYGGGLYVNNESGILTCDGGSFEGNSADYGGGIYVDGGVELQFGNGLIVSNQAAEVGGGIYLSNGKLVFTDTQNFGIYNNSADVEAADIYASGSNTQIVIPDVKTMDLKGFDVPGSELYWVYDNEGQRYEEALWNLDIDVESLILDFDGAAQKTISDRICLDLGYDLVFVTLVATGLAEDDHAEIEMLYPKATQGGVEKVPYRSILFTGVDGSDSSVVIGIPSGNWYLEGTDLGVKYNPPTITPPNGYNTDNSINITREKNSEITLAYTAKQESIQHVVIYTKSLSNIMTPGGGN